MESMGYAFEVMASDIDEKKIRFDDPKKMTLALATAKAENLLAKIKEPAILITTDLVVICNNKIREKPENAEQAREYLRDYAIYPAETVGAVVVTNTATGKQAGGVDIGKVYFSPIPESVIEKLILKGDVFDAAGSFMVEEPILKNYIKRIEGEWESVMGLPKSLTARLLHEVMQR